MQNEQFALHAAIEERHWWFVARRHILRQVIQQVLRPGTGGTVVDIGCGTGANLAALASEYRCFGVDTSATGLEHARRRFPQVEFRCGEAPEAFESAQRAANVFLLTDVIEHVPDDFLFFSRIWQALQPGAHLLLTVPADESLWSEHDVSFGHYRRYDMARLERVWQGLPVTVRLHSCYVSRLFPLVKLVRTLNRWRGGTRGMAGTDFSLPPGWINAMLQRIMAGEGRKLVKAIDGPVNSPYRRGVSLIALLRRERGEVHVRERPADVLSDRHQPRANSADLATPVSCE